jgi:LysM repeat protein
MSKRLFLLLATLCLFFYNVKSEKAFYPEPTFFTQDGDYFLHTVERGQTVYSIAAMYNVSVDDIYRLNPESKKVIRFGAVLKIPQESGSYIYHTIQPQETLYSLAQQYHMKGEDIIAVNPGLEVKTFTIGKIIRIPTNRVTAPIKGGSEAANRSRTNALLSQIYLPKDVNIIKIALLLPFEANEIATSQASPQKRMLEYLEGFLLALKDIKKEGISVHFQMYDTGSGVDKIPAILKKPEMQDIHLLVGGLSDEQIKLLSKYAKERGIPYIIPLTSKTDEPFNNSNAYQVNTPHSYLYSKASLAFINKYGKDNIIIVSDETGASNQKEFIDLLKEDLQGKNIQYKTVTYSANFQNDIKVMMSSIDRNVVIPSDDSPETLTKITPPLKAIVASQPNASLTLFGYPVWQVYGAKFSSDFFLLNTTFYAHFYVDPTSPDVKNFNSTFYKWYTRILENTFPKYGMLGYDTGMYFIRLIHNYGSAFDLHINELKYNGVQTDFHFERLNNWSGFINTNMYLINYNSDYTITKSLIK